MTKVIVAHNSFLGCGPCNSFVLGFASREGRGENPRWSVRKSMDVWRGSVWYIGLNLSFKGACKKGSQYRNRAADHANTEFQSIEVKSVC